MPGMTLDGKWGADDRVANNWGARSQTEEQQAVERQSELSENTQLSVSDQSTPLHRRKIGRRCRRNNFSVISRFARPPRGTNGSL